MSPSCSLSPLGWGVTHNEIWVSPNPGPGLELYGNPARSTTWQSSSSQGGRVPRALGLGGGLAADTIRE